MRTPPARDAALLVLTMVAAASDAISYLGLGNVFPANMTGNTVLMAIGIASGEFAKASRSAVALGGFVVGAATIGALRAGSITRLRTGLAVEAGALAAAGSLWSQLGAHPAGGGRYALVALLGAAMGLQSGIVLGLGTGVSTTFITGTWTTVATSVAGLLRPGRLARPPADSGPTLRRQVTVVLSYFAAALFAAYLWIRLTA